jgi:hypothetical protein
MGYMYMGGSWKRVIGRNTQNPNTENNEEIR